MNASRDAPTISDYGGDASTIPARPGAGAVAVSGPNGSDGEDADTDANVDELSLVDAFKDSDYIVQPKPPIISVQALKGCCIAHKFNDRRFVN